jgi:tetratricopeptide (TPR) repeat protein
MRALAIAVILLGAGSLRAAPAQSIETIERAHFASGESQYAQGHYALALQQFQEAYRVGHRAAFLYNIGVCLERLGRIDEAIEAYTDYLRLVEDAPDRAVIQAHIVDLHQARVLAKTPREVSAPTAVAPAATATPTAAATPTVLSAQAQRPAPRRRLWIWGVVGGALAVAAGVTVGVVVGTRASEPSLLPSVNLR